VGDPAPDFTLEALSGPPITLSQYRGKQNVILVFYRGYW
jgi:peroxiredoxin